MRTTESRNPVSVPTVEANLFDRVKVTNLKMSYLEGTTRLACRFEATDGQTILPGHGFMVNIGDLEEQENLYPRVRNALDNMAEVLGLYYKHQYLTKEIDAAIKEEDFVKEGQLSVLRDAVESDLRRAAPLPA